MPTLLPRYTKLNEPRNNPDQGAGSTREVTCDPGWPSSKGEVTARTAAMFLSADERVQGARWEAEEDASEDESDTFEEMRRAAEADMIKVAFDPVGIAHDYSQRRAYGRSYAQVKKLGHVVTYAPEMVHGFAALLPCTLLDLTVFTLKGNTAYHVQVCRPALLQRRPASCA